MNEPLPLLEFDGPVEGVIEPGKVLRRLESMPEHLVFCFFQEVVEKIAAQPGVELIFTCKSEIGPAPIYRLELDGQPVALMHPGVGAPLVAAFMDEVIALGARKFIACGGAGVLDQRIAVGHLLVPSEAVRDEGTSFHYMPPSREVAASPEAVAAIEAVLTRHKTPYLRIKTWTTDAIYRETPERVERRRAEGCLAVEMEASALFAVAQFRGVTIGHILYGGDDVSTSEWDERGWLSRSSIREQLFWLAAEACLRL